MREFTGRSLGELLKKTAEKGKRPVEEISCEILEEKSGFLGVGKEITISAFTKKDIKDSTYDYTMELFDNTRMGVALEIYEEEEDSYKVILSTSNNVVLIGRNGQTLQAISTALKSAVSGAFKRRISVLVDVSGYKSDKYRKEYQLVTHVAKSITCTKTGAILDPMPNGGRKAVHSHLLGWEYIKTEFEDEGGGRRLKIMHVK